MAAIVKIVRNTPFADSMPQVAAIYAVIRVMELKIWSFPNV